VFGLSLAFDAFLFAAAPWISMCVILTGLTESRSDTRHAGDLLYQFDGGVIALAEDGVAPLRRRRELR